MKKLALLTTMIICCTFATWAQPQGLSFTIYPEKSGEFRIFYSTYKAPSGKVLWVHWGEGDQTSHEGISSGSDPQKWIAGTVTYGKPIRIWCDYIDAILIYDRAEAIRCESNNPQLQYIYYFHDNLSPENLEALYMSLYNRNGKTGHGELHLSQTASIETASTNILKSNAFIPEGINWRVCSMKSFTGSSRTHWKLHKNECKKYLIPAITFQTKTTANMTDLQIGIKDTPEWPWIVDKSLIRIDDGTDNYNSLEVLRYPTNNEFEDNAPRLTIKGTGSTSEVKIYGAMVSHFMTNQIRSLNLDNITNLRFLTTRYSDYLTELLGINQQKHLNYLDLSGNKYLLKLNVNACPNLETLRVGGCRSLGELWFTKTKLQSLHFGQCTYLPRNKISTISDATKLNRVFAENLNWDACELDAFYRDLRPSPPPDALIYVDDKGYSTPSNDWAGSNKTIATDKGWSVARHDQGRIYLSGNGGGCSFTNIPDNNFFNALKALGYANGAVGNEIPTANLKSITILDVSNKNISDLTGIQDFEALTTLKCITNNLSVLDVSKNTALTKLDCTTNNLSVLDVSKNTALIYLYFSHNKVKSLNLSSNKALKELNANYNNLNTLDVSNNTALKDLSCYDNSLNTIDVSNNKALESLSCGGNALSVLDVSQNTKLTVLNCPSNTLTSLDIRNGNNANITFFKATDNPNLSCIYVGNKNASYLSKWQKDAGARFVTSEAECSGTIAYTNIPDANFLQALKDLGYGTGAVGNDIPTANLSGITSLTLTYKDISSLTGIKDFAALEILKCDGNNLTSLDVSKNMALTFLDCEQNQITILNVSGNTALRTLNCADNALTSMNLSKNVALEELICYENQIESIDVSKNTALKHLDCRYNKISVLDLSMNTKLTGLYCNDNELISLNVRNGNNANVTYFDATNNPNLSCIYVDDKTADLSFWEKDATATFVNNEAECGALTSVDDIKMQTISIYPNPTNGILNFDFSTQKIQNINISDVAGKKVFEKNNPNQKEVIDLSSFENGTYIITLQIENENKSFKIIKQ